MAQPPQPPRTDSWRFTPGKASDNERPATCPPQAQKNHLFAQVVFLCWRKPIFPDRLQSSIFGAGELNFRVRDGNGWTLIVIDTNYSILVVLTGDSHIIAQDI